MHTKSSSHITFLLLLICCFAYGQETHIITGELLDEANSKPLLFATVFTHCGPQIIGTETDLEGKFRLELACKPDSIHFEYYGFIKKQIKLNFDNTNSTHIISRLQEHQMEWTQDAIAYPENLNQKWILKEIILDKQHRIKPPKKLRKKHYFIFHPKNHDSYGCDKFEFWRDFIRYDFFYFRCTGTKTIECKRLPYDEKPIQFRQRDKHREFYDSFDRVMLSFENTVIQYRIIDKKLFIQVGAHLIILEQEI